jgi:hypothetical protein
LFVTANVEQVKARPTSKKPQDVGKKERSHGGKLSLGFLGVFI